MVGQRLGLVYTKEPHPSLERLKSVEVGITMAFN